MKNKNNITFFLAEDKELHDAKMNLTNWFNSSSCIISEKDQIKILKLVDKISECAYNSGRANCEFEHAENE